MKKVIGTVTIILLLMMPILLVIPLPAIAEPTEALSDAVGGGTGGEFWLDPSILYTGGVTITGDTRIFGQGSMIDLQKESITVVGAYLYIERCTLTNGTVLPGGPNGDEHLGAIELYYGASGFVYDNIIVDNAVVGIYIEDCDEGEIIIKENSILYNDVCGIYFEDSTDITILENIIANNGVEEGLTPFGGGILGLNDVAVYEDDPNSVHNIKIKGNKIFQNEGPGIFLMYMNDVSISSNLIYSNSLNAFKFDGGDNDGGYGMGDGIALFYCPIVSITHNKILANEDGGILYVGDRDWPIVEVDGTDVEVELSVTISYNKIMGNGVDLVNLIENVLQDLETLLGFAGVSVAYGQNVVITYNEIEGNAGVGILLWGEFDDDYLMEPVTVAYNTINGNTIASVMFGVSDVKIIFNKIMGNLVGMITLGDISGEIGDLISENLLIKGNILKDQYIAWIIGGFGNPITIEWNTVTNNMIGMVLLGCESPQILHNTIMYQRGFILDLGELEIIPLELDFRYALVVGVYLDIPGLLEISIPCDGARIAYNTICYNVGHQVGIFVSDDVIVEDNMIVGGSENGIWAGGCEDLTIQRNKITDNDHGIRLEECTGLITDNIIGYSGSLSGNDVGINVTRLFEIRSPITISDNNIIGNNISIYCFATDPTIIGNYIANNVYGIYLYDSNATIGGNTANRNYIIRNFADGVYIANNQSDPIITYNNIYENVGYGINNPDWEDDFQDEARYNWWGAISGPGDPATFGIGPGIGDEITQNFTYSPWLVSIIP